MRPVGEDWYSGRWIERQLQSGIYGITEWRVVRAKCIKNYSAGEGRAEVLGGGATTNPITCKKWRIAARIGEEHIRDPVVGNAEAASQNEFVFSDNANEFLWTPGEAQTWRKIISIRRKQRIDDYNLRIRQSVGTEYEIAKVTFFLRERRKVLPAESEIEC